MKNPNHGDKRWYKINSVDFAPKMLLAIFALLAMGLIFYLFNVQPLSKLTLTASGLLFLSFVIILIIEAIQDDHDNKKHEKSLNNKE